MECSDVTFADMDVSYSSIGLQYFYSNNVNVINVSANSCGIFGIYAAKTQGTVIENARADKCAHGIDVRAVNNAYIKNCVTKDCGQGVFLSWSYNCVVSGCEINRNGTGFFTASGNDNLVYDCVISENELGMYVQKEEHFTFANCLLEKNIACGARITQCGVTAWGNRFIDNFVGSMVLNCNGAIYCNNVFFNTQNRALYFKNSSSIILKDNELIGESLPFVEYIDSPEPI